MRQRVGVEIEYLKFYLPKLTQNSYFLAKNAPERRKRHFRDVSEKCHKWNSACTKEGRVMTRSETFHEVVLSRLSSTPPLPSPIIVKEQRSFHLTYGWPRNFDISCPSRFKPTPYNTRTLCTVCASFLCMTGMNISFRPTSIPAPGSRV